MEYNVRISYLIKKWIICMNFDVVSLLTGGLIAGFLFAILFYLKSKKSAQQVHDLQITSDLFRAQAQQYSLEKVDALTRSERLPEVEKKLELTRLELNKTEQNKQTLQALLEQEKKAIAEQKELLGQAEKKLSDTFKAISVDVLDRSNKTFLDLAQ